MLCCRCGENTFSISFICSRCGTPLHSACSNGGGKTSTGLNPNTAALFCYLLFWLSGFVLYFMESNKFVKFHAMQSILAFGAIHLALVMIGLLRALVEWNLLGLLSTLLLIGSLVLWIFMMLKASEGESYKLPIVSDIVEKFGQLKK